MRKQKFMGLALLLVGLGSVFVEYDITAAILLVPFGVWLILSKTNLFH